MQRSLHREASNFEIVINERFKSQRLCPFLSRAPGSGSAFTARTHAKQRQVCASRRERPCRWVVNLRGFVRGIHA